eukprot:jgi/Phyca11/21874/fgenesh1_pg.PHYCAscaffold_175_\
METTVTELVAATSDSTAVPASRGMAEEALVSAASTTNNVAVGSTVPVTTLADAEMAVGTTEGTIPVTAHTEAVESSDGDLVSGDVTIGDIGVHGGDAPVTKTRPRRSRLKTTTATRRSARIRDQRQKRVRFDVVAEAENETANPLMDDERTGVATPATEMAERIPADPVLTADTTRLDTTATRTYGALDNGVAPDSETYNCSSYGSSGDHGHENSNANSGRYDGGKTANGQ